MLCTSGFVDDVIFSHNSLMARHALFLVSSGKTCIGPRTEKPKHTLAASQATRYFLHWGLV